jgi:hypothetical protein
LVGGEGMDFADYWISGVDVMRWVVDILESCGRRVECSTCIISFRESMMVRWV